MTNFIIEILGTMSLLLLGAWSLWYAERHWRDGYKFFCAMEISLALFVVLTAVNL